MRIGEVFAEKLYNVIKEKFPEDHAKFDEFEKAIPIEVSDLIFPDKYLDFINYIAEKVSKL